MTPDKATRTVPGLSRRTNTSRSLFHKAVHEGSEAVPCTRLGPNNRATSANVGRLGSPRRIPALGTSRDEVPRGVRGASFTVFAPFRRGQFPIGAGDPQFGERPGMFSDMHWVRREDEPRPPDAGHRREGGG